MKESIWSWAGTLFSPPNIDCTGSKSFVNEFDKNVFSKSFNTVGLKESILKINELTIKIDFLTQIWILHISVYWQVHNTYLRISDNLPQAFALQQKMTF